MNELNIIFATMLQKSVPPEQLLRNFRLSQTPIRIEIIRMLTEKHYGLSMREIRHQLQDDYDRVTLYRNLKLLNRAGILNQVRVESKDLKYIVPDHVLQPDQVPTEHVHFTCIRCNVVKCLVDRQVDIVDLPDGYKKLNSSFMVYGICNDCNNKNNH